MRGQRLVDRLEQRPEPLQAVGHRAQRQVQAVRLEVGQQPVGRPVEQVLVQEHGDPNRDAQDALGNHAGGRRGGDEAGMGAAGTGGAVAVAADQAAMGLDLNLQDGGVLRATDGSERAAAAPATARVARDLRLLNHGGQVRIVAAAWPLAAALLAAGPAGWVVAAGGSRAGSDAGLGLAAEELLLAEA